MDANSGVFPAESRARAPRPALPQGLCEVTAAEQQRALRRKRASKDLDNKNKHEVIKRRMGDVV